ncbi:ATP-binding cassette domain-containing protein [Halobaculum sp. MBLA0147]|uniref:ABC transporter ATP-binding protein n=1 Tax=Halobaculum sp. MBLA0147 TaxID=3079934 RepID=UPI0035263115
MTDDDRCRRTTGRDSEPLLSVDGLTKRYETDDGSVTAVDDVSFAVESGSVVGLLGPNGAGKTTTIKCCLGLVEPTAGRIRIGGVDPTRASRATYRHAGAVLEGARNVYWRLTVRENLRFFTGLQGLHPDDRRERHEGLLETLGLSTKADTVANTLSRGMQQKLSIACTLARDTPLVFLDEPTLGLDVSAARDLCAELSRLAAEEDRAVVVSSHDMDVVRRLCDRVVVFDGGRVVVDRPVDSLLRLFRRQAYRIRLASAGTAESALSAFETEWSADTVEVTVEEPDAVYDLVAALERAGATIESMESIEPDLETVFLELTAGDGTGGGDAASTTRATDDETTVPVASGRSR